ncbi:hypothetical protein HK097_010284 [Rhizophlyctis rosea]|uniref:T-cell immunomodulatory protein n=1 Tax=Rhizophlyctis rosea TaxID=64517 RepID=A0AAD5SKE7_9FUNG|nr:hypothetical protein HK097_010284 [Rhizophlyctis rosea]
MFASSGLFEVNVGLGDQDGFVAAFGDFNGDKLTDLFILDYHQHSVSVHTWDHDNYHFQPLPSASLHFDPSKPTQHTITNVVPGDYNYDGKLDVLLMARQGSSDETHMRIYYGNGHNSFGMLSFGEATQRYCAGNFNLTNMPLMRTEARDPLDLISSTSAQPFIVDYNGTMKPDLLGYPKDDKDKISLWSPSSGSGVA